jgi:MscS family membrane protein
MPFAIGDWVKIGEVEGVVEQINLRSTRVRTFEDSMITLPNANLVRASVENFGARRSRRQRFHLRVSYGDAAREPGGVLRSARAYLEAHPNVLEDSLLVELNVLAEPSLGVLVQCLFEGFHHGRGDAPAARPHAGDPATADHARRPFPAAPPPPPA